MIKIREAYKYFTHLSGKESVIPLSHVKLRVYPCKLLIEGREIILNITGPVKGFTHLLNIEKARVEIFGTAEEGYFHFHLLAKDGKVLLKLHRGTEISFSLDGKEALLKKGESLTLLNTETMSVPETKEKISFGCFKKPLLENTIDRRTKLFSLCQLIPKSSPAEVELSQIEPLLTDLFCPQAKDVEHLGISMPKEPFAPFALFDTFYKEMRAAILVETQDAIEILAGGKKLPIAGRATNFRCTECSIDILWRKGRALKLTITCFKDMEKKIHFPGNAKTFRTKHRLNDKGTVFAAAAALSLKAGQSLFVDNITY
jgi:hypothetical protein